MTLQDNEPRCLAYLTAPLIKKMPDWCPKRDTCARHLSIRTDMHISKPVEFRVCMLGKTDKHIEAQHNAQVTGRSVSDGPVD